MCNLRPRVCFSEYTLCLFCSVPSVPSAASVHYFGARYMRDYPSYAVAHRAKLDSGFLKCRTTPSTDIAVRDLHDIMWF